MDTRFTEAYNRIRELMTTLDYLGFDINDPWTIESINLPEEIGYAHGATRMVIWDKNNPDYVAKIALTVDNEKYCQKEVELYEAAVEAGLESHFAWCAEIYCHGEKSVYAMEYLECDYDQMDSESYQWGYKRYCADYDLDTEAQESKDKFSDYYWSDSGESLVIEWFESHLARPIAAKLDRFIYDHDIEDIHNGNIGYRGNQLVLCDYAGYGW